ncbi:SOUL family heme-binding protein [Psychrobacter arenosus]|uniref:SOUL family heme-binding protein n=1 Tax=Psychrobacter arenosus TaxID=256326 RepID=UPI001D0F663D|nr:heme-binding protein [Psychrobacter arenosus]
MATPEPSYTLLEQLDDFELRNYAPKIIAQTRVSGDYDAASRKGFKILANYIFGNNSVSSTEDAKNSAKISMTAPVIMKPSAGVGDNRSDDKTNDTSAKISMTAPVSMQKSEGNWQVSFVMPEHYTMATIPKPNNPAVILIEIPEVRYAVIKFSGLAGEKKVAEKTSELQQWMLTKKLTPIATPELARYNPPWTLPFMRRNEVMIAY